MVTDEMVEKACVAYWGDKNMTSMFKGKTLEGIAKSMRAALEAALSASEPVAFTSQGQIAAARNGSTALLYGKRDEFMNVPLYAAPPAPSLAVKAGREAVAEIRRLHKLLGEHYRGKNGEPNLAIADALEAALSAQVQDVAGWQLVPTEPTDDMIEAFRQAHARKCVDIASHTPTEHPDDGGGPIGYGYRAMLAASPARPEPVVLDADATPDAVESVRRRAAQTIEAEKWLVVDGYGQNHPASEDK